MCGGGPARDRSAALTARVGVVGSGRWGANVVRDLVSLGAEVIVADSAMEGRDRGRRAGVTHAVESAEELPDCDGYVVVTPARHHRVVCEHLLGRSAPVFVEKPPCTDLADVAALAEIGAGRLFVMHKWRYHPGIRALADLAASGRLGTLQRLETTRVGPGLLPPDVDVLWHLGPHDLSIAIDLLADIAPVVRARVTRDLDGRITGCDATMASPGGPEHQMTLAAGVTPRVRRIVLSGTAGSATLDRPDAPAISVHDELGVEAVALPPLAPLAEELRVFLAHLDGGPRPVSDIGTAVTIATRLTELQHVAAESA